MKKSGREAYMETYDTKVEGYDKACLAVGDINTKYNGLTVTKEMSRIIRWGIQKFGGRLIFEGTEVFYNDVFDANEHRDSDTAVEARALFEFFKPGFSRVTFGAGTLIFNWEGKETVPTRSLFRTSWSFVKDKPAHQLSDDELKRITFRNIWYNFQDCSVQEIVQKALKARSSGADGGGKPVGET
jgi:hypothetical protein